jgi:hypothetical protein
MDEEVLATDAGRGGTTVGVENKLDRDCGAAVRLAMDGLGVTLPGVPGEKRDFTGL